MAVLTRTQLQPLLQAANEPCISIFLPTHRRHPENAQDPIRFKNALREAERLLSDRYSPREIRPLLADLEAMDEPDFWRQQWEGLAVFRSPDRLEHYHLPLAVPELVVVADTFHVRPLLRSLQSNLRFFLVALSQNSLRVFEGTATSLVPAEVPDLPGPLAESGMGAREKGAVTAHATLAGGGARAVHGAGGSELAHKEELARYFRAADRAVAAALRDETAPVILAGVGYYHPIYRATSGLKHLAGQAVEGSPDAMTPEELHGRAWPIAEGILRQAEERALSEHERAVAAGRAAHDLEAIVREAFAGRVARLFLAQGARVWGAFDPATGEVRRAEKQQGSHDDDVLDDVAQAVLLRGGDVLTLAREQVPGGGEAAAQLRY